MLHTIWKDQYFDTFLSAKPQIKIQILCITECSHALQSAPGGMPFAPAPSNSKPPLWQMFVKIYLREKKHRFQFPLGYRSRPGEIQVR